MVKETYKTIKLSFISLFYDQIFVENLISKDAHLPQLPYYVFTF